MRLRDDDAPAAELQHDLTGGEREGTGRLRNWMDARLDFRHAGRLRTSYVVASSYRSGSTLLCWQLWKTGRLGAPAEYLNVGDGRHLRDAMMQRLGAVSPEDYLHRLIACRTSRGGVFGLKVHFHHLELALRWCPSLLEVLRPSLFIHIVRQDDIAQAVSMAKSLQTGVWTSLDGDARQTARFDAALIDRCRAALRQQHLDWTGWFNAHAIEPLVVRYEDLQDDDGASVLDIVARLGADRDPPDPVHPPEPMPQSDDSNRDWAERFRRLSV